MPERVVTAALLLAAFSAALFLLPDLGWKILLAILLLVSIHEWSAFARLQGIARGVYLAMTAAIIGAAIANAGVFSLLTDVGYPLSAVFWLLLAPAWLFLSLHVRNPALIAATGWVVLLPTWTAMVELRALGPWSLLGLMALVWIADSAAYFTGRRLGRHKLAPAISPKKTWEGVCGALAAVVAYALAVCAIALDHAAWPCLVAAGLLLYLSILGDLFESWMKREVNLKDSGRILPGHGGALDRIDALTSTLPLAALAIVHLGGMR